MSPFTHLLIGWGVANTAGIPKRDRALVTVAAVIPDIDGIGIVGEVLTRNSEKPLLLWSKYHHVIGHNLGLALLMAAVAFFAGSRRLLTAFLAFLAVHLHLLGDIVGARGPDGYQWPVPYLVPFSGSPELVWEGQWALNAWPNFVITGGLLSLTLYLAWRRGYSPLEMVSARADRALVGALRNRFGEP